jgi:hypothetical protein
MERISPSGKADGLMARPQRI